MLAAESIVAVSAVCQLVTLGVNSDGDEFIYPLPTQNENTNSIYSIKFNR